MDLFLIAAFSCVLSFPSNGTKDYFWKVISFNIFRSGYPFVLHLCFRFSLLFFPMVECNWTEGYIFGFFLWILRDPLRCWKGYEIEHSKRRLFRFAGTVCPVHSSYPVIHGWPLHDLGVFLILILLMGILSYRIWCLCVIVTMSSLECTETLRERRRMTATSFQPTARSGFVCFRDRICACSDAIMAAALRSRAGSAPKAGCPRNNSFQAIKYRCEDVRFPGVRKFRGDFKPRFVFQPWNTS